MSEHQYGADEQTNRAGSGGEKGQGGATSDPGEAAGARGGTVPPGYYQATQGPMGGAAQPGPGAHGGYAADPAYYPHANFQPGMGQYPHAPAMGIPQYVHYAAPPYAPNPSMGYYVPPPGMNPQYTPPGALPGSGRPGAGMHAGQGVHAGMSQFADELANGGSGLSSLGRMLNLDDSEFWKGALIGAAVVLLLTNESVQNALFKTGAKAKEAVKSGVEKVKKTARDATEEIKEKR